jgi:SpoU rRNA methylase family enzyme
MANFTRKSSAVILPPAVEKKVNEIADAFFNLTKKKIVITDGSRTAAQQAVQVFNKILAHDLTIYLNHKAANEIKAAFDLTRSAGKSKAETLKAMTAVLESQMKRKVFISRHLTGRAFDVRNQDMTAKQQGIFKQVAQSVGGVTVLQEGKPPHFHIQLT